MADDVKSLKKEVDKFIWQFKEEIDIIEESDLTQEELREFNRIMGR